ncbi:MAG: P1 family peptidase [Hyphomicrobiaceae bacterium]|nr:P1 family peptidase [Hyphomicrobiaceae bacterium]
MPTNVPNTPARSLSPARDCFSDVPGLAVGHAISETVRTGTTVILPASPAVAGVDVRGGAPGTRDTDALNPDCLVERVHGFVLTGGSVFGLAAADAVTCWLSERGTGLPSKARAIPVVPAAVLYDLGNSGDKVWGMDPPYRALGLAACEAALQASPDDSRDGLDHSGPFGAGYGATAGSRRGGIGSASARIETGHTVGALIAVNSFGEVYAGEPPSGAVPRPKVPLVGQNTTIGIVATDAPLTKAQCHRLAMMAHDGLARAIRPIHTMFDGDTLFACSTAEAGATPIDALALSILGTHTADCVTRAIRRAVGLA